MAGLNCRAGYATDCIPHEGPWLEKFSQTTSLSDLNYSKTREMRSIMGRARAGYDGISSA